MINRICNSDTFFFNKYVKCKLIIFKINEIIAEINSIGKILCLYDLQLRTCLA